MLRYTKTDPPFLPIMAHLVLGYPSLAESLLVAETYIKAGVAVLELQIPFSHPTADGPVITAACQVAIEQQRVSVEDCLEAMRTLRARYPSQEIVVMSYLNRVFVYGPERFAAALHAMEISHLIVPDLPVDVALARRLQPLRLVPVLAANTTDGRLHQLLQLDYDFYYLMSDFKITGSTFSLHPRLEELIRKIRSGTENKARIGIGFGISTPEQAVLVSEAADLAIIGSALIQAQQEGRLDQYLQDLSAAFLKKAVALEQT